MQERHGELNELVDCLGRRDIFLILAHALDDFEGDSSLVLEFHILHERWVMVHVQDSDRKRVQGDSEKLDQELHAVFVVVVDRSAFQDVVARLKDLIDIVEVIWISFNREVHKCNLEFQKSADIDGLALLLNNLVRVLLEFCEDVCCVDLDSGGLTIISDGFILGKFAELFHEVDKDALDVDVWVQGSRGDEELFQGLEMVLIGESLNDALHKVLLG